MKCVAFVLNKENFSQFMLHKQQPLFVFVTSNNDSKSVFSYNEGSFA